MRRQPATSLAVRHCRNRFNSRRTRMRMGELQVASPTLGWIASRAAMAARRHVTQTQLVIEARPKSARLRAATRSIAAVMRNVCDRGLVALHRARPGGQSGKPVAHPGRPCRRRHQRSRRARTGARLSAITGDQYVVENKTGATQRIALGEVKKSAPDGRTILLATNSPFSILPAVYGDKVGYDPVKDFTPIAPRRDVRQRHCHSAPR